MFCFPHPTEEWTGLLFFYRGTYYICFPVVVSGQFWMETYKLALTRQARKGIVCRL